MFTALQQIEGHIVAPTVFSQALRINPLLVIFALLIGGRLYGFAGAFLALPLAAVLRETVVYLREHLVLEPWGTPPAARSRGRATGTAGGRRDRRAARSAATPAAGRERLLPALRHGARRRRRGRRGRLRRAFVARRAGSLPSDDGPGDRAARRVAGEGVRRARRCRASRSSAAPGELRRRDRAERRRQDDAAADPRRRARRRPRARCRSTAATVGWVPQQPAIYRKLSVAENLRLFARLEQVDDVEATVAGMLDQTGLGDRADDPVGTLSGGNQQRVNIAVGLLGGAASPAARRAARRRSTRASASGCGSSSATLARDDGTTVVYTTHDVAEAERTPTGCWCSPTASCCSPARRPSWSRPPASTRRSTSRAPSSASCASAGTDAAWLLLKDLRILRRSPLLVALLVLYPLLVALLVGVALSSGPSKPKVAFANLVPPGEAQIELGGQQLDATAYAARLFENVDPIRVDTREEAIAKVESGEALGALVIPPDVIERLQNRLSLGGGEPRRPSRSTTAPRTRSSAATSSRRSRRRSPTPTRRCPTRSSRRRRATSNLIVAGGTIDLPLVGAGGHPRAAQRPDDHRRRAAGMPEDDPSRAPLEQVSRFAQLAAENLDVSKPDPRVDRHTGARSTSGRSAGRDRRSTYSASRSRSAVADGRDAAARGRHARAGARGARVRPARPRPRVAHRAAGGEDRARRAVRRCAGHRHARRSSRPSSTSAGARAPAWVLALAVAAVAFAALGVAIGALAREVRAASLLAFMLALPVAALALIPSGAVSGALYDVIRIVSAPSRSSRRCRARRRVVGARCSSRCSTSRPSRSRLPRWHGSRSAVSRETVARRAFHVKRSSASPRPAPAPVHGRRPRATSAAASMAARDGRVACSSTVPGSACAAAG